jgi:hypothetical protein
MLGRDFPGAVLELPGRIGEDRTEPLTSRCGKEVNVRKRKIIGLEHNEIFFHSSRCVKQRAG